MATPPFLFGNLFGSVLDTQNLSFYTGGMNLSLLVKLQPSKEQTTVLLETMERFNAACDAIAKVAFREQTANKIRLQKVVYGPIRSQFGLSAQMTVRAISKVCEASCRDGDLGGYAAASLRLLAQEEGRAVAHVFEQDLLGEVRITGLDGREDALMISQQALGTLAIALGAAIGFIVKGAQEARGEQKDLVVGRLTTAW